MYMFYCVMGGIYQIAANLLSYIPTKYYRNRSTSDFVIVKSKRVNFFWNTVYNAILRRSVPLKPKHPDVRLFTFSYLTA